MRRRWHRLLYRVPFGWRYRWQRALRERAAKQPPVRVGDYSRIVRVVWSDPKVEVALGPPGRLHALLTGQPYEVIDPDWWEPRHDQIWRRQDARHREAEEKGSQAG